MLRVRATILRVFDRSALTEFEDEVDIVNESSDGIDFYLNYKFTNSDKLVDPCEFYAQLVLDKKDFSNYTISIRSVPKKAYRLQTRPQATDQPASKWNRNEIHLN